MSLRLEYRGIRNKFKEMKSRLNDLTVEELNNFTVTKDMKREMKKMLK